MEGRNDGMEGDREERREASLAYGTAFCSLNRSLYVSNSACGMLVGSSTNVLSRNIESAVWSQCVRTLTATSV
jgi:hypothetical protein